MRVISRIRASRAEMGSRGPVAEARMSSVSAAYDVLRLTKRKPGRCCHWRLPSFSIHHCLVPRKLPSSARRGPVMLWAVPPSPNAYVRCLLPAFESEIRCPSPSRAATARGHETVPACCEELCPGRWLCAHPRIDSTPGLRCSALHAIVLVTLITICIAFLSDSRRYGSNGRSAGTTRQ